jgi:hypothetical protein
LAKNILLPYLFRFCGAIIRMQMLGACEKLLHDGRPPLVFDAGANIG